MTTWREPKTTPPPAGATHRALRTQEDREVPGLIYSQDVWQMINLATGEVDATIDGHYLESVREVVHSWTRAGWVALGRGYTARASSH